MWEKVKDELLRGECIKKANWKREAIAIALWVSLNLADLVVTMVAMDGGFVEGNPIFAWIRGSITGVVGYKLSLTLLVIVLLSYVNKLHLTTWLNVIMGAVVVWNLALLLSMS